MFTHKITVDCQSLLFDMRWMGAIENLGPTPIQVLLPHEVLDALAGSTQFAFDSILLGQMSDQARIDFWNHVSTLEPWKENPIIKNSDWKRLVGLTFHGDGCEFYKDDEYFVWSWSSVFCQEGAIQDCLLFRFPIAVIPERHMQKASEARLCLSAL